MKNRLSIEDSKRTAAALSRWFVALFGVVIASCTVPRTSRTLSDQQQAQRVEQEERRRMAEVEARWSVFLDPVLERHVLEVANQLGLAAAPRVAFLRDASGAPPVIVVRRRQWYFSLPALRQLRYENEFAAVVALALVHEAQPGPEPFAVGIGRKMVELLYEAGFDPRGVAAFWKGRADSSIEPQRSLALVLQEEARAAVARRVPLSNPVVRSRQFGEIVDRLKEL